MTTATLALLFAAATDSLALPEGLLSALCFVESRHRPHVVHMDDGSADSIGICQMHLSTAQLVGFKGGEHELFKPEINIKYAALYLKRQLDRYPNNKPCAIAAYNSGSCRFDDTGNIRNFNYVKKVYKAWRKFK